MEIYCTLLRFRLLELFLIPTQKKELTKKYYNSCRKNTAADHRIHIPFWSKYFFKYKLKTKSQTNIILYYHFWLWRLFRTKSRLKWLNVWEKVDRWYILYTKAGRSPSRVHVSAPLNRVRGRRGSKQGEGRGRRPTSATAQIIYRTVYTLVYN